MRSFATAVVGADTTTYSYTPEGLVENISYPNGTSASYSYYPTNRVESITHKDAGAATLSSYGYQYDGNGNRTRQVELQNGVSETTAYVYDGLDRLENFTLTSGATTTVTAYTFEGHNRKTETVSVDGATTVDKIYSYDETNWLTQVVDSVAGNTIGYSYDDNGNTTLKTDSGKPDEDLVFEYDVANRLVMTTQGGSQLGKYDYNAQGMRVRHYGSERGDVEYLYDDGAVLEEYSGTLLAHYRYGDRLLSLDAPSDGGIQYYHHDALGSTVNLSDSAGATKVSYSLDPWGHIRNQVGSSVNRQIFTGQEHDTNTGLIYFGARYYDPDTARFISQDSYLGQPGTPPSLHRYLYAYGNPTVYIDLYGFVSNREIMGIDDDAVNKALTEDNSLSNVLWLTAKSTTYTLWNGITGGFVSRQDERQERYDRSELADEEFWTGTGIDTGVSVGAQVLGGAVGGKVAGRVAGANGSKFSGTVIGGATDSGFADLVEQSGQVATHYSTDGRLGQEQIDFKQTAMSSASGTVLSAGFYSAKGVAAKLTVESRAGGKAATSESNFLPRTRADFISHPDGTVVPTPKTDFYVGPDGTTVPSTGYRYMHSKYAEQTMETMSAPRLSYFGFEKINSAYAAADRYQVLRPDWSDSRLRGSFDTLQLFDNAGNINARVPMADGDRASFKEPFASYYPMSTHGKGGGQQLLPIVDRGVTFKELTLLREK